MSDEPTKLERIARVLAMVVNMIETEGARPEAITAMKLDVEGALVILRARTRGGRVAAVARLDESATEDPDELFTMVLEGLKALAAKDAGSPS